MSKQITLIIIIVVAIILVAILGIGVHYFIPSKSASTNVKSTTNIPVTPSKTDAEIKQDAEQQLAQLQKDYPETIKGVINFSDAKGVYKATLKSDSGKEYTLYTPQPESIYNAQFGVKNGQKVEVQGKINDKGNLELASIKPI